MNKKTRLSLVSLISAMTLLSVSCEPENIEVVAEPTSEWEAKDAKRKAEWQEASKRRIEAARSYREAEAKRKAEKRKAERMELLSSTR